jgi:predicted NBD/HSP70 family sugar kinase
VKNLNQKSEKIFMSLSHNIIQHLLSKPRSLAEIKDLTNSSLPTIRRSVQALTASHWIQVVGQAGANGGRPAMLFGIDDSHYMILGLQLKLPGIRLIAADLKGTVLKNIDLFPNEVPSPNRAVRSVVDAIRDLKTSFADREILGLGIAAPGFVDAETGDIITIGRVPSWVNFPICRHLSESTGLTLEIANDVDCMAIAEFMHKNELPKKNLVYIGFCEGIKASLFLQGEMFTGSLGNVGLISPDLINLPDEKNQAEIRRLITTLGFKEVFKERVAKLNQQDQNDYKSMIERDGPNELLGVVIENALIDSKICFPIIHDLINIVSVALANLVFLIQPDEIIIGGVLSSLPDPLFRYLEACVRELIPPLMSHNLIIKRGTMESEHKAAIGATYNFLLNNLSGLLSDS